MPPLKVLILGGAGHVGSALLTHLLARGVQTESVDLGLRGVPPELTTRRCWRATVRRTMRRTRW